MSSPTFSIKRLPRPLIYVLLIALIVRVAYLIVYSTMPDWELLTIDNYYHKHWALDIASGNVFGDTTYFRAPFYVYCLSILFSVFGFSLWAARIFGLLIGLASIFLTYKIGEKLFNQRTAFIASFIQAIFPVVLYFESELLLDALFMFLLELSFYRFIIWHEGHNAKNSLWLGMSLGLAAITRPIILIFILPILAVALWRNGDLTSRIKNSAVLIAGLSLLILPITIRNLVVGHELVPIATQGGVNFYIGNNALADGLSAAMPEPLGHNLQIKDITYIAEKESGKKLSPGEVSDFWSQKTLHEILERPFETFKLFLKKIYFNFLNREISNNRNLPDFFSRNILLNINPLSFGLIFSLAVIAVLSGWKSHWGIRLIAVTVLIYVFAVAIFFFNSRFRLPALPLYFLLAAAGIECLTYCWKTSRRSVLIPLIVTVSAAVFSFAPVIALPKGAETQHLTLQGLNLYSRGAYEPALSVFRQAVQIDPDFPENNLNLGACFLRLGQIDSALYYFEKEKKLHPKRTLSYANVASVNLLMNQPEQALDEINLALELKPNLEMSQLIRIRAASELKQTISADELYRLTLSAHKQCEHSISFLNYGAIVLTNRNALEQAEWILQIATAIEPVAIEINDDAFTINYLSVKRTWIKDKALANYQLGFIYGLQGNFDASIAASQNAISLDSCLVEAYVNLINGFNATGKFAKADSVKNTAQIRFPNDPLLK